jgi:hypothetical protein
LGWRTAKSTGPHVSSVTADVEWEGRIESAELRLAIERYPMNFDQAISAHSDWKRKLSRYLQKPDGSLKPVDIAPDNECELGKWIASEGVKFSTLKEFNSLKAEHARFHKAAAEIVVRADRGDKITEEIALCSTSEFGNASSAVVQAIMHMKAAVALKN